MISMKTISSIALVLTLQACATTPKGCDGLPVGIKCMAVSELIDLTEDPYYADGVTQTKINQQNVSNSHPVSSESNQNDWNNGRQKFGKLIIQEGQADRVAIVNPPAPDGTEPEFVAATKERVWIAPFFDSISGIWAADQIIYIKTAESYYRNGFDVQTGVDADVFTPLD